MHQTLDYAKRMQSAFDVAAKGAKADELRDRAEWAKMMAAELRKQGTARAKRVTQATGEVPALPDQAGLHQTCAEADLAAVEASLERSRLLLYEGTNIAAMAVDAANTIDAQNSLERMLAHQLAAAHKVAMDQMGQVSAHFQSIEAQTKRLNVAARYLSVYQQGLLTLQKLRQNGQQRILVQYVNVHEGGQAVVGAVETK